MCLFFCYSTFFFAYSYFILFLVDVLQSGIWRDANSLVDLSLRRLVPNLLYLRLESRAPSTVQKYRSGWLKWRQWTAPKIGVQVIPAKPLHVALFISELTVISVSNNTGISHSLAGIVECPTSHPLVKSSLKGARRKLACPVQPKEPLSVDTVCRIADHYISSSSLDVIRFLFILLVGLAGFEENDQYREVHTSLLARSHKATCPVSITERLLKLLPSSTESSSLLVRRIV